MQLVCDWLNDYRNGSWLIVLDNIDDSSSQKFLANYLPCSPEGSILITTRDDRLGSVLCSNDKPINILPMSVTEATALIRSKLDPDQWSEKDAEELLGYLSFLPLAITQAAAYLCHNPDITISDYLEKLRSDNEHGEDDEEDLLDLDIEDRRRDSKTESSVMRTWKLSFDQILKENPLAADILSLMAFLDRSRVPRSLLRNTCETEWKLKKALSVLQAFSLTTAERTNSASFSMHRVVHLLTRKWIEQRKQSEHWRAEALRNVSEAYPRKPDIYNWECWAECEALMPHVDLVLSYPPITDENALQRAAILSNLAVYEVFFGQDESAREHGTEGLKIHQRLLKEDDLVLLQDFTVAAQWFYTNGRYEEAKEMSSRAALDLKRYWDPITTIHSKLGVYWEIRLGKLVSMTRHEPSIRRV